MQEFIRRLELVKIAMDLRALVYKDMGQKSRARAEFEKLYAEAPDFEDVAEHLGL